MDKYIALPQARGVDIEYGFSKRTELLADAPREKKELARRSSS